MFSIIRSFTSLYWVIRDIFRPLFRTTFFWLVLLALGVWLILSGRAGAEYVYKQIPFTGYFLSDNQIFVAKLSSNMVSPEDRPLFCKVFGGTNYAFASVSLNLNSVEPTTYSPHVDTDMVRDSLCDNFVFTTSDYKSGPPAFSRTIGYYEYQRTLSQRSTIGNDCSINYCPVYYMIGYWNGTSYENVDFAPVDPGTGGYEDLITEQDFKNYNMSMCIEKNLSMVNDFDLRTNLTACKISSDSNVASGGTDIFMSMIAFYDQIANGSYTTNRIPWDTFDVYDSFVIQNCKDVHTSRNSLMLTTRDPNIKPRNDQMLSAYNILDQMRPLYNTNSTISHDYEQARSSCELSLNIIYELQKTEITDFCTGVGCIIENIMQQETPIVNSWLNPVGTWIAGIIAKIENIFTAITGTNTALDGVKNAIEQKNMSFTGYTDIINNITGITVDIPDVVVDIPDINIDLGYSQGTSTGGIFSFLNEYTTISTEYIFVPNMCKNTTPTNYDNRKNLIMLFMVTITTLSFYFIIIRR